MRRIWNGLLYLLAAGVVFYSIVTNTGPEDPRRPSPQPPGTVQGLPSPAPPPGVRLRETVIDIPDRRPSVGTAFAIADGWWMTARHVVDGCDSVGLVTQPRKAKRVAATYIHPRADLALLQAGLNAKAMGISARTGFARGQDGFVNGFPQGKPGDVHARYMGNLRLRSTGRYKTDEVAAAWAESERVPRGLSALGGISGGPMRDRSGAVVGVMVASSKRRGRVITVLPATMRALAEKLDVPIRADASVPAPTNANYVDQGNDLRRELRVAKVVCWIRKPARRPAS